MRYHKVVGIDLGTTYAAVSVWDYDSKEVVVIPTEEGESKLPTVVALDDGQMMLVGREAERYGLFNLDSTISEIRGLLGTQMPIHLRGHTYLPQEISSLILAKLKRQAEQFIGEEVHDAVIAVPAWFGEAARVATKQAAAAAGLNIQQLLAEPIAVAVSFGLDVARDGRRHIYAVYDLGGRTLDVSLVATSSTGEVSVVSTAGDLHLGGDDFDNLIANWVLDDVRSRQGIDLLTDHVAKARIKQEAELRRRELSVADSTVIDIPLLKPGLSVHLPLSRKTFTDLIEPVLQRSLNILESAITSAGFLKSDVEQVLVVGGASSDPQVRVLLAAHFGHLNGEDIRSDGSPEGAVSRGAALIALRNTPTSASAGLTLVGTPVNPNAPHPSDVSGAGPSAVEAQAPFGAGIAETHVTNAGNTIELHAGHKVVIIAGDELRLVVADNEIVLDSAGITIRTSGVVRIQGNLIRLN